MKLGQNCLYTQDHEWVKEEDGLCVVGITDYAQSELGDIVFVNLPEPGDEVFAGEAFGDVESVKAVAEVNSPVTGIVAEINEKLLDEPESINDDPFGSWFIKVEEVTEKAKLLSEDDYKKLCESQK